MKKLIFLFLSIGGVLSQADHRHTHKNVTIEIEKLKIYFNDLLFDIDEKVNETIIHEIGNQVVTSGTYSVDYRDSALSIYMYIPNKKLLNVNDMEMDALNFIRNIKDNTDEMYQISAHDCLEGQVYAVEAAHRVLYTKIEKCVQFRYQVYDENLKAIKYNRDELANLIKSNEAICGKMGKEVLILNCLSRKGPSTTLKADELYDFVNIVLDIKKKFYLPDDECGPLNFDLFNRTITTAKIEAKLCVNILKEIESKNNHQKRNNNLSVQILH